MDKHSQSCLYDCLSDWVGSNVLVVLREFGRVVSLKLTCTIRKEVDRERQLGLCREKSLEDVVVMEENVQTQERYIAI